MDGGRLSASWCVSIRPYYDNVMYAELADFFYVWEKRTLGHLWPEFFDDELTNKDEEAVANVARFGLHRTPQEGVGDARL